jgi:hypothetical protein
LQSISVGDAINPLAAFYDIHGKKRGAILLFCLGHHTRAEADDDDEYLLMDCIYFQIHEMTGPVPCTCCDKIFNDITSQKRHLRVTRAKMFPRHMCTICKQSFMSVKAKWDHQWAVHKYRVYVADCPVCKKPFRKYQDVKKHILEAHKDLTIEEFKNISKEIRKKTKRRTKKKSDSSNEEETEKEFDSKAKKPL